MTRTTRYARTGALPAIAAALALSSTPLLAQQAPPTQTVPKTPTSPPPPTDATPPTTSDTAPATRDTSTTVSTTQSAAPTATATHRRTTTRTTHVTARAAPAPARTVTTKTVTTRTPAPPATPPAAPTASNGQPAAAPVVDLTAKPAKQSAGARPSNRADETLPIAGGALALLALGGAAYAISRRRRRRDEEAWHGDWADEPEMAEEEAMVSAPAAAAARDEAIVHDEQPAIVAPPAFSWGHQPEATAARGRDPDDDRLPGESWVERAHRGPSANNPSVSLKNRLRRAAFFDKRERDVAAGLAEPIDPDAGLPDAVTGPDERELA